MNQLTTLADVIQFPSGRDREARLQRLRQPEIEYVNGRLRLAASVDEGGGRMDDSVGRQIRQPRTLAVVASFRSMS